MYPAHFERLALLSQSSSTFLSLPYLPKTSSKCSLLTLRVNLSANKVQGGGVGLLFLFSGVRDLDLDLDLDREESERPRERDRGDLDRLLLLLLLLLRLRLESGDLDREREREPFFGDFEDIRSLFFLYGFVPVTLDETDVGCRRMVL